MIPFINNNAIVTLDLDYFGSMDGESNCDLAQLENVIKSIRSYTLVVDHHDLLNYITSRDFKIVYNIDAHTDIETFTELQDLDCSNWLSYLAIEYGIEARICTKFNSESMIGKFSYLYNSKVYQLSHLGLIKESIKLSDYHVFISLSPEYTYSSVLNRVIELLNKKVVMNDRLFIDNENNDQIVSTSLDDLDPSHNIDVSFRKSLSNEYLDSPIEFEFNRYIITRKE